ncbi:hypothetical protein [Belnapia sp. F-4-1]|uniref:hypothetical protein n=1 Tax=Belnapia sp. F-4-1 TaxID=1545443 RepID=UPI0005BAD048|nr:hypothetical protein [Belnapia sp. F-4-1]
MASSPAEQPDPTSDDKVMSAAARRAEQQRTRYRIAEQRARSEQAGGKPSEDEASRMVAEFYARGGQVTVCPPAEEAEAEQPKR